MSILIILLHLTGNLKSTDLDEEMYDLPEGYDFWYDPPYNRTPVDSFLKYSQAFPGGVGELFYCYSVIFMV